MLGCKHSVGDTVTWRSRSKNRPRRTGPIVGLVPAGVDFWEAACRLMPADMPRKSRCKADPVVDHARYIVAVKREDGEVEYYGPAVSRIDGSNTVQPAKAKGTSRGGSVDPDTDPDWSRGCDNCGQKPIVPVTGQCGPCTFGEADTMCGNW